MATAERLDMPVRSSRPISPVTVPSTSIPIPPVSMFAAAPMNCDAGAFAPRE